MSDILHLIKMLQSNNSNARYDACEQLRVSQAITQDAIAALRSATVDKDSDVADAARRALARHININDEMKAAANYTIKVAKEKFRQELDFSEQSIVKLEDFLEQAYQSLSSRVKDEKTSNSIARTANAWGSYLGEYMRLKWGGAWILKGSERILSIKNIEFSPIGFVYQKITNHPEYSVKKYFAEAEKKISPPPIVSPQIKEISESVNQPKEQTFASQPQNTVAIDKKLIFAIAGIGGTLLVIAACIVGFMIFNIGGVSAEFKTNLNAFLVEGGKLNVLTEQGVSNGDFRNQLAEVKSAYSLLDNSWTSSLSEEKKSFDQAIKGWELTLQVWDMDKKGYIVIPENSILLKECTAYANLDSDYAKSRFMEDWIGTLMGKASQHFEAGKASVANKIK